ncbi:MAG: helix-turn-helix transcriptional regulator [Rhizobiales bacterium]|nr:helix-turn-helix transcriptional regulator [Hyphomicrobiales bacterium]
MANFEMRVRPVEAGQGNIAVYGDDPAGTPDLVQFWPLGHTERRDPILEMRAEWGGRANPLVAALPSMLSIALADDPQVRRLSEILVEEARAARCGSDGALSRLCEVLIIHLMRREIERGSTSPGLVSGLSDNRLSRAIVAMHNDPGRRWNNRELADLSHLSLSRFAELFPLKVGLSPQAYLRKWRLTLARRDVEGGVQVQSVARKLGYSSAEALTHAFKREFGATPRNVRARQQASTAA